MESLQVKPEKATSYGSEAITLTKEWELQDVTVEAFSLEPAGRKHRAARTKECTSGRGIVWSSRCTPADVE